VLATAVHVPCVQQQQRSADVRLPVAVVGTSGNRTCAICPTVAMVRDVRVPVAKVGASSNRVCAMCRIVTMGEVRSLLLGPTVATRQ
jgi:hypothetical protein